MTGHLLHGNSMDDYPLTLTSIVERAERFHADREVVSRRPSGAVTRTTLGSCARRARRLARALAALGVSEGDPVATLLWNQSEHLELYFAVPAMGAVIHTLNPRLFPDELAYIVDEAQDKVIVVDESLLQQLRRKHCLPQRHLITYSTKHDGLDLLLAQGLEAILPIQHHQPADQRADFSVRRVPRAPDKAGGADCPSGGGFGRRRMGMGWL